MYNKDQIRMEWKRQLAIDFNCTIEDFDKKENVITIAKSNQGRRIYTQQKEFFRWLHLAEMLLFLRMKRCIRG